MLVFHHPCLCASSTTRIRHGSGFVQRTHLSDLLPQQRWSHSSSLSRGGRLLPCVQASSRNEEDLQTSFSGPQSSTGQPSSSSSQPSSSTTSRVQQGSSSKRRSVVTTPASQRRADRPRLTMETSLLAAGAAGAAVLVLLYRQFSSTLASKAQGTLSSTAQAMTQVGTLVCV